MFFPPNHGCGKAKEVSRSYLNVPFFFILPIFESLFGGFLYDEIKEYPVLYNKQIKGYTEKDVVTNAWRIVRMLLPLYTRVDYLNESINLIKLRII